MSIGKAISIAAAYKKRQVDFQGRHEMLSRIFKGTRIIEPMAELIEYVAQAVLLNRDAVWLPKDESTLTESEYFIACIKRDQRGSVVRSLADVPEAVQPEYVAWDEQGFQQYLKALRDTYRLAQEEMEELCSGLECAQDSGSGFFIKLSGWIDEESIDYEESADDVVKQFENLSFNLGAEWLGYIKLGCSLIQMANEPPESLWLRFQAADIDLRGGM